MPVPCAMTDMRDDRHFLELVVEAELSANGENTDDIDVLRALPTVFVGHQVWSGLMLTQTDYVKFAPLPN